MKNIEELINRFFNGELNKEEIIALQDWINTSESNFEEFITYRNIWLATAIHIPNDKFDSAAAWEKISDQIYVNRKPSEMARYNLKNKTIQKILQIAAMFILFVSLGAIGSWLVFPGKAPQAVNQYCEVVTPQGSKSKITLPDGSVAWINAASKLSYTGDYNKSERLVNLEGEAYFNVKSNKEKPFIVQTPYLKVKAYGTVFNVKAYPDEKTIETTLVEGMVEIVAKDRNKPDETYTYTLKPKQNIIYHIDTGLREQQDEKEAVREPVKVEKLEVEKKPVQVMNNIKPELYTSWKDENWVIEGIPLDELAILMGRRYNSKIELADDALKLYKFSGTIQNETLEQVLVILRLTTPLDYKIGKGNVSLQLDKNLEKNYSRILKR